VFADFQRGQLALAVARGEFHEGSGGSDSGKAECGVTES